MAFDLDETLAMLERTPAVLDGLLRGASAAWHGATEGGDTWSPLGVVGHLIQGEETNWVPRARIILEHGTTKPFDTFDRTARFDRSVEHSMDELLDEFARLRQGSLATVRGWRLSPAQLRLEGRHPALGTVTLGELLATWLVHDLDHVVQIARVMAKRYDTEVGPWRAYLSVLTRS